jgi:hypothetical protein
VSDRPNSQSATVTLGFLTIAQDPGGWLGGYLVTNGWGRPLEFRLTTAVQPNRVQQVLYGPTLMEYLHADLIGKALVEKTAIKPELVVTDAIEALGLWSRVNIPVLALRNGEEPIPADFRLITTARSSVGLLYPAQFAEREPIVVELLDRIDQSVDLSEPFARVREAVAEARKSGVINRAA